MFLSSNHNRPTLKYDISKMAIGLGRLYFSRLAYNPVPGLRKSGIPAAEKDIKAEDMEIKVK